MDAETACGFGAPSYQKHPVKNSNQFDTEIRGPWSRYRKGRNLIPFFFTVFL
nr:MAG TPA: hypothetical protein [Caudoviricetes sp.]